MVEVSDNWTNLWSEFDSIRSALSRSRAINVNSGDLRNSSRSLVQLYFRTVRPELETIGIDCTNLDADMQRLIRLASGRNAKTSYQTVLRSLTRSRNDLEVERERLLGAQHYSPQASLSSGVEQAIVDTLERLVPSAALSYRQAVADIRDSSRLSFRGPAADLRECLRETLDNLAPDKDVEKAPGFKLEKKRSSPTMKQKVRFILKSRGEGSTARSTPETAVARIEESAGALARSLYSRGSVSTHIASTQEEVRQLKLYLDGVLAELLQIHRSTS